MIHVHVEVEKNTNSAMVQNDPIELASRIEHTNLKTTSLSKDIVKLCAEAKEHEFRAVCVAPNFIKLAKAELDSTNVKVATVIDFPFGYSHTASKVESIKKAKDAGADAVDVVTNYGFIVNDEWSKYENDIETVVYAANRLDLEIKLILETGLYPSRDVQTAAEICLKAAPDFVKTNTGFAGQGATEVFVKLIRRFVGAEMGLKASGGIKTGEQATQLINAGADIIGCSSSLEIIGAVS